MIIRPCYLKLVKQLNWHREYNITLTQIITIVFRHWLQLRVSQITTLNFNQYAIGCCCDNCNQINIDICVSFQMKFLSHYFMNHSSKWGQWEIFLWRWETQITKQSMRGLICIVMVRSYITAFLTDDSTGPDQCMKTYSKHRARSVHEDLDSTGPELSMKT